MGKKYTLQNCFVFSHQFKICKKKYIIIVALKSKHKMLTHRKKTPIWYENGSYITCLVLSSPVCHKYTM